MTTTYIIPAGNLVAVKAKLTQGAEDETKNLPVAFQEDDLRDFPEDFQYENGCYSNLCLVCATEFIGHKRRRVCKVCETAKEPA